MRPPEDDGLGPARGIMWVIAFSAAIYLIALVVFTIWWVL